LRTIGVIGNILCVDTATTQNERQQSVNTASTEHEQSINTVSTECQQSVNDFECCILCNSMALLRHILIIKLLTAVMRKEIATWSQPQSGNERQQCVNDFVYCILNNPRGVLRHLPIIEVLAAFIGNIVFIDTAIP